jgi:hypothetical protein
MIQPQSLSMRGMHAVVAVGFILSLLSRHLSMLITSPLGHLEFPANHCVGNDLTRCKMASHLFSLSLRNIFIIKVN